MHLVHFGTDRPKGGSFFTEAGLQYDHSTIRRYFAKAKQIAGITRRVRFHDLRHTFGSKLARSNNIATTTIRDALGHRSVKTTERYARPDQNALKIIAEVMNRRRISNEKNSEKNTSKAGGDDDLDLEAVSPDA